ncbi:MAG TPA: Mut7-C RNAse domain-containing protein [Rectinemataceae bacterium]|nr:Mut7-C RNAse domain-containing protein [Rectinemataceae bacterium]
MASDEDQSWRRARIQARGSLAFLLRHRGTREDGAARELSFRCDQSLGHLAEGLGIPSLEIGAARADGEAWPLELPPPDRSQVELFPLPEPVSLQEPARFILDLHLGRLARMLRLLGFDAIWWEGGAGPAAGSEAEPAAGPRDDPSADLLRTALAETRILLSRDRALLFRRELHEEGARRAMLIRSPAPYAQLLEVVRRFGLESSFRPFSRCAACGSTLISATREEVLARIPSVVAERYDQFFLCPDCGKAYWKGDHFRNIRPFLDRLAADLPQQPSSVSRQAATSAPVIRMA